MTDDDAPDDDDMADVAARVLRRASAGSDYGAAISRYAQISADRAIDVARRAITEAGRRPSFWCRVEFTTGDTANIFDVECRWPAQRELQAFATWKREPGGKSDHVRIARALMIGWRDVHDEAGALLPFTEGNRDAMLAQPGLALFILDAFTRHLEGNDRA